MTVRCLSNLMKLFRVLISQFHQLAGCVLSASILLVTHLWVALSVPDSGEVCWVSNIPLLCAWVCIPTSSANYWVTIVLTLVLELTVILFFHSLSGWSSLKMYWVLPCFCRHISVCAYKVHYLPLAVHARVISPYNHDHQINCLSTQTIFCICFWF